jgi:transposase
MQGAHRRHDISDATWTLLEPLLPGRAGMWGRIAKDNRLFINAVFRIPRTGAPLRDLPPEYGKWGTVHQLRCAQAGKARLSAYAYAKKLFPMSGRIKYYFLNRFYR